MKIKTSLLLSLMVIVFNTISCKDSDKKKERPKAETPQTVNANETITLEKLEGSVSYPDASLELKHPETEAINNQPIDFNFEVKNYKLGRQTNSALASTLANSGKGQHIHFIVDNDPYSAHYEPGFSKELSPGIHHIVAFLSRSYHESVKNENSFVAKTLHIGSGSESKDKVNLDEPTLIYSRPKGEYSGKDTENLLLDFFLLNADLSENGYKIRATINDTEFMIDQWAPYIIKGLSKGEVRIHLQLLDENGSLVEGTYNDVRRKVTLKD